MDFFDVVAARRSVRAFKKRAVEKEDLAKILESINSAPSAGNLQSYEIIVVKDSKRKLALAEASFGQKFIAEAPVVIAIFANMKRAEYYKDRGRELYCINDASIAATYAQLAATALGLSTVWVGKFDDSKVSKILDAPEFTKPVALLPLGYADEKPRKTKRRNIKDIVHEEGF